MKKIKMNTLENTANMWILWKYTRNTPCYTQFYIQVPFTLYVISLLDQEKKQNSEMVSLGFLHHMLL